MAQLTRAGEPICRWCKEVLPQGSRTRPREVHPEHARLRRTAIASGRWTTPMDDALSLDEVDILARLVPAEAKLSHPARELQAALNALHMHPGGEYPAEVVAQLAAASARLLEAIATDAPAVTDEAEQPATPTGRPAAVRSAS